MTIEGAVAHDQRERVRDADGQRTAHRGASPVPSGYGWECVDGGARGALHTRGLASYRDAGER